MGKAKRLTVREKALAFVAANEWRFAKTMAENPHWYLVRHKARPAGRFGFDQFVAYLKAHAVPRKFGRATYRYLELDGFRYWPMGWCKDGVLLVNRARMEEADAVRAA